MRVLVSFPVSPSDPKLHKSVVFTSWRLLADKRYQLTMEIPSHKPFENNLHKIVEDFLKENYAFWLSIDADNPPRKNPLDLIKLNRDIIGLPTPVWHYIGKPGERPIYWNAYDYVPNEGAYKEHNPKIGLQKVDAIGTGCFLVSKRVFLHKKMQGAFTRILNKNGTVLKGNDIAFCERARYCGFDIYAHYDYPCDHFTNLNLNEVTQAFEQLYKGN